MLSERVKKLPAFYGNRNFIIMVKTALHFYLFWARTIRSRSPSYSLKINFSIVLPSPPRFSNFILSFTFPNQRHKSTSRLRRTYHILRLSLRTWPDRPHGALSAVQMTKLLEQQVAWIRLFIVINSTAQMNRVFAFPSYGWKMDICKILYFHRNITWNVSTFLYLHIVFCTLFCLWLSTFYH